MSQYIRDHWGPEKGFPSGRVYAIAQSTDGYLWIGTEAGLVRFDGLTFRLIEESRSTASSLGQVRGPVLDLAADDQGGLWVRFRGLNLLRYRDGAFYDAMADLKHPDTHITVMARTRKGEFIFATSTDGVLALRGGKLETLVAAQSLPVSPVISLAETPDGDVWIGTREVGLFRLHAGQVSAIAKGLPDLKINCLLNGPNGELFIGTDRGVVRWNGSEILTAPFLEHVQALAMIADRDSNAWVATGGNGLFRVNAHGVSTLDPRPGQAISAIFEDREGNLWSGSANGLERLRDSVFATYSTAEGLPSENNGPVYTDPQDRTWFAPATGGLYSLSGGKVARHLGRFGQANDVVYSIAGSKGGLWIGTQRGGLTHLSPDRQTETFTTSQGLAQNSVFAVTEGRDGSVWAGTLNGGVSRLRDGRFTTYRSADGLASDTVSSILETSDGAMWFATPSGLSVLSNARWRTYTTLDGLPSENVNCLFEDSTGTVWIGTLGGLASLRAGRIQVPAATPSFHEQIFGIAEDKAGSLWIATENHVLRVNRDRPSEVREYGIADGLHSQGGIKRFRSVVADSHGRIWFSMVRGLSVVDPARLTGLSVPALVQIQSLSADGSTIGLRDPVHIPAGSQRIRLEYAGLSLSIPERTAFRYTLDGFDHGWSEPVSARDATYTNLSPGPYRFHVIASNLDGAFNSVEATLAFRIEPTVWQSDWFRLSAVLALAAAMIALIRLRTQRLTNQMNLRFQERLAERTRIAQELHDTLLQGFLSASMQLHVAADNLPEDSPAKPPLAKILKLMTRVIGQGRDALRDLRLSPGDSLDLEKSFSRIQHELGVHDDVEFRVIVEGRLRPLHPILRDEVYRIGREALVNAFRHSQASSVEVEIAYAAREFRVLVRDNGCGIDPEVLHSGREGHWGLPGMRERAERIGARLRVWSGAAKGTEVELSVPGHVAFKSGFAENES